VKITLQVAGGAGGTGWTQYVIRFVLGGLVTLLTGLIAKELGPEVGGLFLAFPAIFPASATLIAKRERLRKARKGLNGTVRGCRAAALDAAGAVLGGAGLVGFAVAAYNGLPQDGAATALGTAMFVWLAVSLPLWWLRKTRPWRRSWEHTRRGGAGDGARPPGPK